MLEAEIQWADLAPSVVPFNTHKPSLLFKVHSSEVICGLSIICQEEVKSTYQRSPHESIHG
jgi:hypothetical protein